jgi:hypothetical protein
MGVPTGGGVSLGAAQGRIIIDLSDLNNVRATTQQIGVEVERNLGRMGTGAARAQTNLSGLAGTLRNLGGAFGVSLGAAGIAQVARFAVQVDAVATAYRRQSVAAQDLAGSQARLNELLQVYDRVTGGAVDRATALSDVTRLMAVGFADTAGELEEFVRAARGISVATGQQQDYVISQLQLAIANQSTLRLDQLGLGVSEVQQRIDDLRQSNSSLTKEMAYQQAILGLAAEKFGGLVDSAEAQATGAERAAKAWKDVRLELGELASGPVSFGGNLLTAWLQEQINMTRRWQKAIEDVRRSLGLAVTSRPSFDSPGLSSGGGIGRRGINAPLSTGASFSAEQGQVIRDNADALAAIEKDAGEQRADVTRQYEEQRTSTIRQYEQTIARESEDFARNRARAEREFQESIIEVRRDSARREAREAEQLARTLAEARADSEKRVNKAREDANERLAELEEDYQRRREKAEKSHRERILTAAGRLDAVAIREEQRRFAEESATAKEAHDEQRSDLQEQLAERIADERENLDDRIKQAQEAHDRQLKDARDADDERIRDMQDDFDERKRIEDEDRRIRLERMAEDHDAQLDEMARQHGLRIQQIADQAQEERDQQQTQFNKALAAAGIQNDAWIKENQRVTNQMILDWTRVHGTVARQAAALLNLVSQGGSHPSMADPYINRQLPISSSGSIAPSGSRSVVVQSGAIQISVPPQMNQEWIAGIFYRKLLEFFEDRPQ